MTTFVQARAELITALASVGNGATSQPDSKATPYVLISGDGGDMEHVLRGAVLSTWRAVLVAGGWDAKGSADALDAMKDAAVPLIVALAGWRLDSLGRDGIRTFGGKDY